MRRTDERPTAGAATAAGDGAPVADSGPEVTGVVRDAVQQLTSAVDTLAGVDLSTLPEACVTDTLRGLAAVDGRLDALSARLVAHAQASGLPAASGAASTTSWVAEVTGRSHGQAARTGKLSRALADAPALGQALADGKVGPDQAATIASALDRGTLDERDADDLLRDAAVLPPGAFARETRRREGRRQQQQLRNDELAAREARYLTTWRLEDGSLRGEFQLDPATGDLAHKALNAFVDPDPAEVPDDQRRTPRQLRADAFAELLEVGLSSGAAGDVGGVRPHVTLMVPVEALAPLDQAEEAGVTSVTDQGTVLSVAATRKVLCDASIRRVVIGPDSRPLDVGRATRTWSPAQRAAVAAVDGGCRAPGSDVPPDRCVVHHLHWWGRDVGDTSVDRGLMLSHHGHALVHDQGWTVEMDPDTRICTWTDPDGTQHITHPRGPGARGRGNPCHRADDGPNDPDPTGSDTHSQPASSDPPGSRATPPTGSADPPGHPSSPGGTDPPALTLDL